MKKTYFVFSMFLITLLVACNNTNTTTQLESKKVALPDPNTATTKSSIPPPKPADYTSPFEPMRKTLADAFKTEYVVYGPGVTFETEGNDALRFATFITDTPADLSNCSANYDGGVVYKNKKGDIILAMDFNYLPPCNRIVFTIDGKTYKQKLSPDAMNFFAQFTKMEPPSGGGKH